MSFYWVKRNMLYGHELLECAVSVITNHWLSSSQIIFHCCSRSVLLLHLCLSTATFNMSQRSFYLLIRYACLFHLMAVSSMGWPSALVSCIGDAGLYMLMMLLYLTQMGKLWLERLVSHLSFRYFHCQIKIGFYCVGPPREIIEFMLVCILNIWLLRFLRKYGSYIQTWAPLEPFSLVGITWCSQLFVLPPALSLIWPLHIVLLQFPLLHPGEDEFVYESCTPLPAPKGSVEGSFTFVPGRYTRYISSAH